MAILSANTNETINNFGTLIGSLGLGGGTNLLHNQQGGLFNSGPLVDLTVGNTFLNEGTLSPGGQGTIQTTQIIGDLVLGATSILRLDIDSMNGSDKLEVNGSTTLGGSLVLNPLDMLTAFTDANAYNVIFSADGITGSSASILESLPDLDVQAGIINGGQNLQLQLVSGMSGGGGGNPSCSINMGVLTCSGLLEFGVLNFGDNANISDIGNGTIRINGLVQDIVAPAGQRAIGFQVDAMQDIDLTVASAGFDIITSGQSADGIFVENTGGDVDIVSDANIITDGTFSDGIVGLAVGEQNVSISSSGDILLQKPSSFGLVGVVFGSGNVDIQSTGSLTGSDSRGENDLFEHISVFGRVSEDGNVTITTEAPVLVIGGDSSGLVGRVNGNGDVNITALDVVEVFPTDPFTEGSTIEALVGGNGNITIRAEERLLRDGADFIVNAEIGGNGNIDLLFNGELYGQPVDATFANSFGSGVRAAVMGEGDIAIESNADVFIRNATAFEALGGTSGDITLNINSNFDDANFRGSVARVIAADVGDATVNIVGDLEIDGSAVIGSITNGTMTISHVGDFNAASPSAYIDIETTAEATLIVNTQGNLTSSYDGANITGELFILGDIVNPVLSGDETIADSFGTIALTHTGDITLVDRELIASPLIDVVGTDISVTVVGNLLVDGSARDVGVGQTRYANHGITNAGESRIGGTTTNTNAERIAYDVTGSIIARGVDSDALIGALAAGGEGSIALRGGPFRGGTDDGSGINLAFSEATSTWFIDLADDSTLSALSGLAIRGGASDDTVMARGGITGLVDLAGGDDEFVLFSSSAILGDISFGDGTDRLTFTAGAD